MAKKRLFVSVFELLEKKNFDTFSFDEGEEIAEVQVVRKFKLKFDDKNNPIIPEAK